MMKFQVAVLEIFDKLINSLNSHFIKRGFIYVFLNANFIEIDDANSWGILCADTYVVGEFFG
jgi:hypothetical protein